MESTVRKVTDAQFRKFSQIVYREAGINLTSGKRDLLNARLAKKLRIRKLTVEVYLDMIQKDPVELLDFLDAISTNHTFFFREPKSFKYIQPGFEKIWCAASSSGEEPYSLLISGFETGLTPTLLATDISDTCLEKARQGVYAMRSVEGLPKAYLKSYFQRGRGKWSEHVRLKDTIRQQVTFQRFNLLKDQVPNTLFDIIFCRNVMIYFDSETKEKVVHRLLHALRPGGYFMIGGAESLSGLKHPLEYIEPSVYQKK